MPQSGLFHRTCGAGSCDCVAGSKFHRTYGAGSKVHRTYGAISKFL